MKMKARFKRPQDYLAHHRNLNRVRKAIREKFQQAVDSTKSTVVQDLTNAGWFLQDRFYCHKECSDNFRIKLGKKTVTLKSDKGTMLVYLKCKAQELTGEGLENIIHRSIV